MSTKTLAQKGIASLTALATLFSVIPASTAMAVGPAPFNAEYFNNKDFTGTPALTRTDAAIDFDWGTGSPDPSINNEDFSARWTATQFFDAAGDYRFTMCTDDGGRLYIDGNLLINDWQGHAVRCKDKKITLSKGNHVVKMEYYEDHGGAIAKLGWKFTKNQTLTDYDIDFWNFNPADAPEVPMTAPDFEKTYPAIDFKWDGGSPDPSIHNDYFVAEAEANKLFEKGEYQFVVVADDGVRLWVDDELIINEWSDHASSTFLGNIKLNAGIHHIRLHYFERGGGAILKFSYNKVEENLKKFTTKCYNNIDLFGTPVLERKDDVVNFNWGNSSPAPAVNNDLFSCSFSKKQTYSAGDHKFTVTSDDGTRLYIDGQLVLWDWMDHAATTSVITKNLTAGQHEIKLEYYERGGGALVTLIEQ